MENEKDNFGGKVEYPDKVGRRALVILK